MNVWEFLSGLGFWQWCGVLCLAAIVGGAFANVIAAIRRRRDDY